ncbi:MAG: dihydrolipoamide acetyltransferase family protein [Phycisphaeraceae bacterium]
MPIDITMPRLSDTMQEGTLIKWRVKVGDKVSAGDKLADIETDKATQELEAYDDGTIAFLAAEEGATLPVGGVILVLATGDEKVEDVAAQAKSSGGGGAKSKPAAKKAEAKGSSSSSGDSGGSATAVLEAPTDEETETSSAGSAGGAGGARLRVSPLARKMAEDAGLDVAKIKGTGPDGRVIKRDVQAAAEGKGAGGGSAKPASGSGAGAPVMPAIKLESKLIKVTNMRKTIARVLVESKQTIPHFTVTMSVNIEPLMSLRSTLNGQLESQGVKLSVNDFVVRASALALAQHPIVNSSWAPGGEGIQIHGEVNVGVAVALPEEKGGGLVVPTLRNTTSMGLRQISSETKRLAKKARDAGLSVEEMSGGTFTISNLGMFGVDHFTAIINPPQAAILAVGAGQEKPIVRDGQIVIGQEMSMTLSADHRIVDGATAAIFLQTLKGLLENPAAMLV